MEENIPGSKAATDAAWRGESESVLLVSDLSQLTVKQRPKGKEKSTTALLGKLDETARVLQKCPRNGNALMSRI